MLIFINLARKSSLLFEVSSNETVYTLKSMLEDREGINTSSQRLVYNGKELRNDSLTLSHYNVKNEGTIHVLMRLLGKGKLEDDDRYAQFFNMVEQKNAPVHYEGRPRTIHCTTCSYVRMYACMHICVCNVCLLVCTCACRHVCVQVRITV